MQWILLEQEVRQCQRAAIVQVLLTGWGVCLKGTDHLDLALIQRLLTGLPHVEVNQLFIARRHTESLNPRSPETDSPQRSADGIVVRGMRELHVDQRTPPEVYT